MIPGFTRDKERQFVDALNSPAAEVTARVDVLNRDHQHLASFQRELIAGDIQNNRKGDVDRSASLTLLDEDDDLNDLDLRHFLRAWYGVILFNGEVLWCPVFTGPVTLPRDNGDETATLDCGDKMLLALQAGFRHRVWHKGMPIGRMVHDCFEDIGEDKFDIPRSLLEGGPRLAERVVTGGPDEAKAPGRAVRRVCQGRLQVFYDALGRLVVRRFPEQPVVTWVDPDLTETDEDLGSAKTAPIRWQRDLTVIRNTVDAKGKKKAHVVVDVDDLMKNHIYSPTNLMRGGRPQSGQLVHFWSNDKIARERLLRIGALRVLRQVSAERSTAEVDCVPTPWVGSHDLVKAERRDGRNAEFYFDESNMPLLGEGDQSVGYQHVARKRRGRRARIKL